MSPAIACLRSWAETGALMAQAKSMAAKILRRIGKASSLGGERDHVEQGFEMGIGQDEPPAIVPDALDDSGHVALVVAAVAKREALVAELERAEEDLPARIVREERADRALRTVEPREMEPAAVQPDPAAIGGESGEIGVGGGLAAELDRPAAVIARRQSGARQGRVGIEQRAFAGDLLPMAGGARPGERVDPGVAPMPDAGGMRSGHPGAPILARLLGGRRSDDLVRGGAGGERQEDSKGREPHRASLLRRPAAVHGEIGAGDRRSVVAAEEEG